MIRWDKPASWSVKVMSTQVVPATGFAVRCDRPATARFVVRTLLVASRLPARGPSDASAAAITVGSAYRASELPLLPFAVVVVEGAFSEPNALTSTRCDAA